MDPIFSPDGHSVAFVSYATGLTANPANPAGPDGPGLNLYVRNLTTGDDDARQRHARSARISSGVVSSPAFSPDGGSLAYLSTATDLTNNTPDPILPPGDMTAAPSTPSQGITSDMSTYPVGVEPLTTTSVFNAGHDRHRDGQRPYLHHHGDSQSDDHSIDADGPREPDIRRPERLPHRSVHGHDDAHQRHDRRTALERLGRMPLAFSP